jgi:hypothetical protein
MKLSTLLFLAFFCFVILDLFSTYAATSYLGTFDNEKNGYLRAAYDMGGYLGVTLVKVGVCSLLLVTCYFAGAYLPGCEAWARGVLTGSTLTGIFISISNLKILFTNSSLWIMNIDAATMSICVMVGTTFIIAGYELFFKNNDNVISESIFQY